MKKLISGLILFYFAISFSHAKPRIAITFPKNAETTAYASNELRTFLSPYFAIVNVPDETVAAEIIFATNPSLKNGSFSVNATFDGHRSKIFLEGSNEASMLHAMYSFLEKIGFRFEITGPISPKEISIDRFRNVSQTITPVVLQRGIRQHINFPMDISSYPLEEAKEYIRNLSRLRLNHIIFHSYPGQWYEALKNDTTEYAGHFFYGQVYDIPANSFLKKYIRNQSIFCIPSIEPIFNNKQQRSKMAMDWLREVMKECKRVGLTIRFSFEPRSGSIDVAATVKTAKGILDAYPLINEFEIITEETGGWEPKSKAEETENELVKHFGKEALLDRTIIYPVRDGQAGLAYLYGQIGHNIKTYKALVNDVLKPRNIKGSLGIYVTVPEYLKSCYQLLNKYAPEASYAILPGHGARRTNLYLSTVGLNRSNWSKTTIYSWFELDGIMYLQQNDLRGVRRLIEYAEDINGDGNQIQSIAFNHWRTAENSVVARYAALSAIYGALDENLFYTKYAKDLGIVNTGLFGSAMKQIDDAGWFATTDLGNIGFCYAGVWGKGFGYFGRMRPEKLKKGLEMYNGALTSLREANRDVNNEAGKRFLSLIDNRLRTTLIYLKAFEKAAELQQYKAVQTLSKEERTAIAKICEQSISLFEQYIELYAQKIPDRGVEGTLISVYHTPIAVLKRIKDEFSGTAIPNKHKTSTGIDAPPPPSVNN